MTASVETYARWHRAQVTTGDLDPTYPVLRHLAASWGLDRDAVCWLVALHVAYYHVGSALAAFARTDGHPAGLPPSIGEIRTRGLLDLPCGRERRGHTWMPDSLAEHLLALADTHREGGYDWYGRSGWDWTRLNDQLVAVVGNGRWAAYKTTEMVQKVAGAPLVAADAGHRYSSGPRKGLELLYPGLPTGQTAGAVAQLDKLTADLATELGEPDLAQVETSLCDFHSLNRGGYYLGHDVDAMLGQLLDPRVPDPTPQAVWQARADVFDWSLLGEVAGWAGPRTKLKGLFRATGLLDWRELWCSS